MQAQVFFEQDVVVVRLSGRVDVETAEPFREVCFRRLVGKKVVFDFRSLGFVGSTGILPFVETICEFAGANSAGFKFCGVSTEFRRIFSSTSLSAIEIFDDERQAVAAFSRIESSPSITPAEPAPILRSVEINEDEI